MKGPTYLIQPAIERLPNLLEQLRAGDILIPRFQRPFVWTDDQRLLLLRSIYEGMPIGSILVWRTREHELEAYGRLGHLPVNRSKKRREEIRQYLLDGHQRLTTLYTSMGEGLSGSDNEQEPPSLDETAERRRPVYFDLIKKVFELEPKAGSKPSTWLPLSILLDPYRLYDYQKRLLDEFSGGSHVRNFVNRSETLATTFKDYAIPVVPIVSEDLDVVTESFTRVNRAGTPMDEVHMLSAMTWTPEFDLNERMSELRTELGEVGWEDLEERWILNTCKAALDLSFYDAETEVVRDAVKVDHDILERAKAWLKQAALFLGKHCNVYGPGVLPYRFQAVLLADAIRLATNELSVDLPSGIAANLEKWFWLTTYTEYFGGINTSRLRKSLEHIREVAVGHSDPYPADLPEKVAFPGRFDFRSARSRAICLRLSKLNPLSPSADTEYDIPSLLAKFGKAAAPMLVPSANLKDRLVAESVENRILTHPRDIVILRERLFYAPHRGQVFLFQDDEVKLLRSHAIGDEAEEALRQGDLAHFFRARRSVILGLEREFVSNLGLDFEDA